MTCVHVCLMQRNSTERCRSLQERQCLRMVLPFEGLAELLDTSYAKHVADNTRGSLV